MCLIQKFAPAKYKIDCMSKSKSKGTKPQSTNHKQQTAVGIIMGSDSDLTVMKDAAEILQQFQIPFELTVVSAHRTPLRMMDYAETAKETHRCRR